MLQASALIPLTGKASDSYVQLDLMRLPLGILSGIGFIGGGAIIKRENMVAGVTTAATLWFVTVLGLCFGGGQYLIGWSGFALGLVVLLALRVIDLKVPREMLGTLKIHVEGSASPDAFRPSISAEKMRIDSLKVVELRGRREFEWKLAWKAADSAQVPGFVSSFGGYDGVAFVAWEPTAGG